MSKEDKVIDSADLNTKTAEAIKDLRERGLFEAISQRVLDDGLNSKKRSF